MIAKLLHLKTEELVSKAVAAATSDRLDLLHAE